MKTFAFVIVWLLIASYIVFHYGLAKQIWERNTDEAVRDITEGH